MTGLMLQTVFRNPLAGPDVFGINSGAALGVAIVMLAMGGSLSAWTYSFSGFIAILLAAFVGAMAVTGLIFLFSTIVRSNTILLIIGIMVGYVASSAIELLNFFSTEEGVKSYTVWGMGDFGGVTNDAMPAFAVVVVVGLFLSILLIKPLNALLLGEEYAESMGINTRLTRNCLSSHNRTADGHDNSLLRTDIVHRTGHATHSATRFRHRQPSATAARNDTLWGNNRPFCAIFCAICQPMEG